jgi:PIN domain nuclease of toxin-antitoxin system
LTGYLLDTHSLVWAIDTPEMLSEPARKAVAEGPVYLSVVSLWELIIKRKKESALLADPVDWWNCHVSSDAMTVLSVTAAHIAYLERLPEIHRDPFDRILLCQAAIEGLTLITRDSDIALYSGSTILRA